ncbi:MAG: Methylthioacryloyl-CoA hydratase [Alphaproteobacteria bacterium MarineAlpha11_Bin1]|nr:MAG: Methylthioacryloyl-CoA hydratase [Alphaproteobacteria bacterium MarineAlpha11_Bin1]
MIAFSSNLINFEMRGKIAILTLDRPEKRNAVNENLIEDINRFFNAPPKEALVVVLRANGDHFCAGLDLSQHKERDVDEAFNISRYWHQTFDLIQYGGIPVVAAMHGAVMGGGLELATAAHVRIAEPSTIYQLPEGRRGIYVGGGASIRVARVIGPGRMTEIMLTGRRISAEEGQQLGLSHYRVGDGEAFDKAMELAETISGNAPLANKMMLNTIQRIDRMGESEGYFVESLASALTQASDDAKEGMRAFLEKRDIRFDK